MTEKETKKMTVAQMLRKAAEGGFEGSPGKTYSNLSVLMGGSRDCLSPEICRAIADKVEAEIEAARSESLRQGAELWATANGQSGFREGEGFGEWLERCFLRLPMVDGEPLAKGMEIEGCADPVDGWCVYEDGSGSVLDEYSEEIAMIREYDCPKRDSSLHLKRPEVLDADGVPIKAGDTVWVTPGHEKDCGFGFVTLGGVAGLRGVEYGKGYAVGKLRGRYGNVFLDTEDNPHCPASWLTHKEPDSLEKLRDEMKLYDKPATELAILGEKPSIDQVREWADRLTALIEKGGE